jgi:hypothetical protein
MNIPAGWQLPGSLAGRLGESGGWQRALVDEGHILLVLHRAPKPGSAQREVVYFWRLPDGEWKCSDGRPGLQALRTHLDGYLTRLQKLEENYERAQSAHDYFEILESVVPLQRAAKNQFIALHTAREALPEASELATLRDLAGDAERAADLLHASSKNALDYKVARQAEEQAQLSHDISRASHRLNLLMALFLPMSVVGAAFGSTLRSGLEEAPPWVFWLLLFGALTTGLLLRGKGPRK